MVLYSEWKIRSLMTAKDGYEKCITTTLRDAVKLALIFKLQNFMVIVLERNSIFQLYN